MGAIPYSYTLSLSLPSGIKEDWLNRFTKKLFILQKKYNFFLIGGDISLSKNIHISSNFFGYAKKNLIISRNKAKIGNSIWVTGNIGNSYVGLLLKKNKIKVPKKIENFFLKKYLFPLPNFLGPNISKFCTSAIDISDGFIGDLNKLINSNMCAELNISKIPFSQNVKILIKRGIIDPLKLMNAGDDYELIFTTPSHKDVYIQSLAKKNNCKITKVGRIAKGKGIKIDKKIVRNLNKSFQYFF